MGNSEKLATFDAELILLQVYGDYLKCQPPVVYRRAYVLFVLFVFVCVWWGVFALFVFVCVLCKTQLYNESDGRKMI
jgi:hypothetical protein